MSLIKVSSKSSTTRDATILLPDVESVNGALHIIVTYTCAMRYTSNARKSRMTTEFEMITRDKDIILSQVNVAVNNAALYVQVFKDLRPAACIVKDWYRNNVCHTESKTYAVWFYEIIKKWNKYFPQNSNNTSGTLENRAELFINISWTKI